MQKINGHSLGVGVNILMSHNLDEEELDVLRFAGNVQKQFNQDVQSNIVAQDSHHLIRAHNHIRPERLVDPRKLRRHPNTHPQQTHTYPADPTHTYPTDPPTPQQSIPLPSTPKLFVPEDDTLKDRIREHGGNFDLDPSTRPVNEENPPVFSLSKKKQKQLEQEKSAAKKPLQSRRLWVMLFKLLRKISKQNQQILDEISNRKTDV